MHLDIFNNDAFSLSQLTLAINDLPLLPTRLGELGYFTERGITTTSVSIERVGQIVKLVDSKPRGSPGTPVVGPKRKLVSINAVHLPESGAVMADEVQNVRAFGSETDVQTVQGVVNDKLGMMKLNIDLTLEWQRMGAIKGQVLDADGTTVLLDMFDTFGFSQQTHSMELDNTATLVRMLCTQLRRKVEAALGGIPYKRIRVMCSPGLFDALTNHPAVMKAYEIYLQGEVNRADNRTFSFGDITWEEYVGSVNGVPLIETDCGYAIPEGVPAMFSTLFAPADYNETVNTKGLPYYAKQEKMRMDKGIELEAQSNPIQINARPNAVVKVTLT
jgi:hypothetical protein